MHLCASTSCVIPRVARFKRRHRLEPQADLWLGSADCVIAFKHLNFVKLCLLGGSFGIFASCSTFRVSLLTFGGIMVPWEMSFRNRASLKIELAELRSTEIAVTGTWRSHSGPRHGLHFRRWIPLSSKSAGPGGYCLNLLRCRCQ